METLMATIEKSEIDLFMDRVERDFPDDFYKFSQQFSIKATKKKILEFYVIYRRGAFAGLRYSTDKNKRFLRKMRRGEI